MNKITMCIVGLVLIALSFYGGMKYDQSQRTSARQAGTFDQFVGQGVNGRGGLRGGMGANFVTGQIISKDRQSITIQLMGTSTATQGSQIVLLSASTTISKTTDGLFSDLTNGQDVVVTGTKNSDDSLTASSIQLRPAR